ncbi:hypothetical protein BSR28_01665 [Boudabousia liubingyangii]|nr:hypothetical protein BSR28_01665 [Boudabousia liubingyangii]
MRLDSLTGLRWWAAFGVFLYHLASTRVVHLPFIDIYSVGNFGVAFFFVLSGFVLTWSAKPEVTARQFYVRRFARIYPSHFVALLLAIPVFYRFNPDPQMWWQKSPDPLVFITSLFLIQGLWQAAPILFGGNPAAWTLSCEATFYAIFPGLKTAQIAKRSQGRKQQPFYQSYLGFFGLFLLVFSAQLVVFYVLPNFYQPPIVITRLPEFFYGVLAAMFLKGRKNPPKVKMWWAYVLLALATVVYLYGRSVPKEDTWAILSTTSGIWMGIVFMFAIMIGALADITGQRSLMRNQLLVKGGEWSYCFYLVHATVIYIFLEFVGKTKETGASIFMALVIFSIALVVTAMLHYLVEKPCEKRLRAWGDARFQRVDRHKVSNGR